MCDVTPHDTGYNTQSCDPIRNTGFVVWLLSLDFYFVPCSLIVFAIAQQPQASWPYRSMHSGPHNDAPRSVKNREGIRHQWNLNQVLKKIIWISLEGKGVIVLYVEVYSQSYCFNFDFKVKYLQCVGVVCVFYIYAFSRPTNAENLKLNNILNI